MSNAIIDARGLNYQNVTGVNTVSLHILYELSKITAGKSFDLDFLGLQPFRLPQLIQNYPWLTQTFSRNIGLTEYLQGNSNARIGSQQFLSQLSLLTRFYAGQLWLASSRYEIVYQTQPKPILIPRGAKLITTFHDIGVLLNVNNRTGFHRNRVLENRHTYQILADRAHTIIVNSYSTAYDIERYLKVPGEKIKVIYLALPAWTTLNHQANLKVPTQLAELPITTQLNLQSSRYFLALSGFEYRKNFHNLILAWARLNRQYSSFKTDYKLIIAGSTVDQRYFTYLQAMQQDLNLTNLILLPDVPAANKQDLLRNCVCLVYPSLYEGFGFPILEANQYGKAVITSSISAMPEIAGQTAIFVNPLSIDQIADAMYILATDSNYRTQLEQATASNLSRFSWDEYHRELPSLLNLE